MDWDNVRVFLAVARAGQFVAAARRLGLDHATASRRVAALEAALGAHRRLHRARPRVVHSRATAISVREKSSPTNSSASP